MYYDPDTELINYEVTVKPESYLAIGYGSSMMDTDMSYWMASDSANTQMEVYATKMDTPQPFPNDYDCYTNSDPVVNADNSVTFKSTRPLDCNTENTFVIELDKSMPMISAYKVAA